MSASSKRNTVVGALVWWYAKRMIRKRGAAALAGLAAGEGLSLVRPGKQHRRRWLLLLGLTAGAGLLWWRRKQTNSVEL